MPTLHAFIVGISRYRHLPKGSGAPAPPNKRLGLEQLTCAAMSAWHLHEWLKQVAASGELPFTLSPPTLLLSPSNEEREAAPQMPTTPEPTVAKIGQELDAWRLRASTHREDLALFYFAGHGIQETFQEAILLACDACDPADPQPLRNSFRLANIVSAMAPSDEAPPNNRVDIARNQVFLVDACRLLPAELAGVKTTVAQTLLDEPLPTIPDDRSVPVIQSAQPGATSYGRPGGDTLFMRALLASLRGGAARRVPDDDNVPRWQVTVEDLWRTLSNKQHFVDFNDGLGAGDGGGPAQMPTRGGSTTQDILLVNLAHEPSVRLRFTADLPQALPTSSVELRRIDAPGAFGPDGGPLPKAFSVPAGNWQFAPGSAAPSGGVNLWLNPPSARFRLARRLP